MSFSVDALQALRLAPKREAVVSPPVDEALVNARLVDVRLSDDRLDTVVVAKVEVPITESVLEKFPVVAISAPRFAMVE